MTAATLHSARTENQIIDLPLEQVKPWIGNPRRGQINQDKIEQLAESIKRNGLLQPIIVRPLKGGKHLVADGECRYRACRLLKLPTIPATIRREESEKDYLLLALEANHEREDIHYLEYAAAFRSLRDDHGMAVGDHDKPDTIAGRFHMSQPHVSALIRIDNLPDQIKQHGRTGRLSQSHLEALARYTDWPVILEAKTRQALDGASSREVERLDLATAVALRKAGLCETIQVPGPFPEYAKCLECKEQLAVHGGMYILCADRKCCHEKWEDWSEMLKAQDITPTEQPEPEPEAPESHSVRNEEEREEADEAPEFDYSAPPCECGDPDCTGECGENQVVVSQPPTPTVPPMEAVPVPAHVGPQEVEATATRAEPQPDETYSLLDWALKLRVMLDIIQDGACVLMRKEGYSLTVLAVGDRREFIQVDCDSDDEPDPSGSLSSSIARGDIIRSLDDPEERGLVVSVDGAREVVRAIPEGAGPDYSGPVQSIPFAELDERWEVVR